MPVLLPEARAARLAVKARLEAKLGHDEFAGRAREFVQRLDAGAAWRDAADAAGLRRAAARTLTQHVDVMDRIRRQRLPAPARAPASVGIAEIEAACPPPFVPVARSAERRRFDPLAGRWRGCLDRPEGRPGPPILNVEAIPPGKSTSGTLEEAPRPMIDPASIRWGWQDRKVGCAASSPPRPPTYAPRRSLRRV